MMAQRLIYLLVPALLLIFYTTTLTITTEALFIPTYHCPLLWCFHHLQRSTITINKFIRPQSRYI